MHNEERFLKSATKPQANQAIGMDTACREATAKEMLLEKAESLRREAHDLETLARELPADGSMSPSSERTLRNTIALRIYR